MQAVILAGGEGSRLRPFTTNIPKPLVPIGDLPILEVVLRQLKYQGFTDIVLAVNRLAELIMAFFGKGEKLGLNISYSVEDKMLGTAGPIALIDNLDDNFLVLNGDLLSTINYRDLFDYHLKNKGDVTISTYKKDVKIDLGVLEVNNDSFVNYIEKPTYSYTVSMGIYVFNKSVVRHIRKGELFNMPDFILKLNSMNKVIKCYSGDYYWLDIGRVDDYEAAVKLFKEKRSEFLPDE
jgi:NDP-sugar pyrophosphorylase family protein